MSIKFVSSVLLVEDVKRARHFYESLLGQNVEFDYVECVVFSGGVAIWDRDYAQKLIFGDNTTERKSSNHDFELYFETDDLDGVCAKLEEANVQWVHRMLEQPWGQRVVRVFDPDQYVVEIGEPIGAVAIRLVAQGMTIEEASSITSVPIEIISKML